MYAAAAALFMLAWSKVLGPSTLPRWRPVIWLAMLFLAIGLAQGFLQDPVRFGFAQAVTASALLAACMLGLDRALVGQQALWRILLPVCALASVLPMAFAGGVVDPARPWFVAHLIGAVFSYSLILLAVGLAVVMTASEKALHRSDALALEHGEHANAAGSWLKGLPPLLVLERLMFRVIGTGFVALTLTLLSGVFFTEQLFGKPMRFDHKTVFALAAWVVFAVLLLGRALRGWRGRVAVRFTLVGFGLLVLAYVGTHFVLEVILKRVAV
jgi:ABC-type uncharacterized transport system permease subunit